MRTALVLLVGVAVLVAASGIWMARHMQLSDTLSMPPLNEAPHRAPPPAYASTQLAGPQRPSFDIVRINPQGSAVLAGRAAPGAEVVVRQGTQVIGQTKAGADGDWVLLPTAPLAPGAQELTLSERIGNGAEVKADRSVVLVVPPHPTETQQAGNGPAQPLAVLTEGAEPPRVLQGDTGGQGGPPRLGLGTVDYGNSGKLRFAGTAVPGSTVRLYVDKHPVGEARVQGNGSWTLTPPADVAPGQHRLRLDQLSAAGKVEARVELPFTRAQLTEAQLAPGRVIVQPGQSLWLIARHNYGYGVRYLVIYRANQGQIRDPNLIYPGQVFTVPAADNVSNAPDSSSRSR